MATASSEHVVNAMGMQVAKLTAPELLAAFAQLACNNHLPIGGQPVANAPNVSRNGAPAIQAQPGCTPLSAYHWPPNSTASIGISVPQRMLHTQPVTQLQQPVQGIPQMKGQSIGQGQMKGQSIGQVQVQPLVPALPGGPYLQQPNCGAGEWVTQMNGLQCSTNCALSQPSIAASAHLAFAPICSNNTLLKLVPGSFQTSLICLLLFPVILNAIICNAISDGEHWLDPTPLMKRLS